LSAGSASVFSKRKPNQQGERANALLRGWLIAGEESIPRCASGHVNVSLCAENSRPWCLGARSSPIRRCSPKVMAATGRRRRDCHLSRGWPPAGHRMGCRSTPAARGENAVGSPILRTGGGRGRYMRDRKPSTRRSRSASLSVRRRQEAVSVPCG
jgi:hypothetical protein